MLKELPPPPPFASSVESACPAWKCQTYLLLIADVIMMLAIPALIPAADLTLYGTKRFWQQESGQSAVWFVMVGYLVFPPFWYFNWLHTLISAARPDITAYHTEIRELAVLFLGAICFII